MIDGIVLVLRAERLDHRAYNLATGRAVAMRELAAEIARQYSGWSVELGDGPIEMAELELAHDLDAPLIILMPGRRHALSSAPVDACRWWLDQALNTLLTRAEALGVTLALETNPYGYLGSAAELAELVDEVGHPSLGIAYDVANTINQEDPADGVRTAGHRIRIAHMSDTWREKWAHTSPGRGEVDFERYGDALREIGFDGVTIFELIDMEPPLPRLRDDIATFGTWGWSTAVRGTVPSRPR